MSSARDHMAVVPNEFVPNRYDAVVLVKLSSIPWYVLPRGIISVVMADAPPSV